MIARLASSPAWIALAVALVHSLWQGAALALACRAALAALPRRRAAARYLAACVAMVAAPAAFVATFLRAMPVARQALSGAVDAPDRALSPGRAVEVAFDSLAAVDLTVSSAPSLAARVLATLALAWVVGAAISAARLAAGVGQVRRLERDATAHVPAAWQAAFEALARRMGFARAPRLLASTRIDVPMAVGFLRPVVLVPWGALTGLDPRILEALLAHELAHIGRLDGAVGLVASVIEVMFFFHPGVRYVASVLRAERENAADDRAAGLFGGAVYARALVEMESFRQAVPAPALGANGGALLERVRRLVASPDPEPRSRATGFLFALLGLGAIGAVAVGVASCADDAHQGAPAASEPAAPADEITIAWLPATLAPHRPLFVRAGAAHGVDPGLLAIVTLVESAGDPAAQSPMGAVGLMQMLPATAEAVARRRGLAAPSAAALRDPSTNVDLGAAYLAEQLLAHRAEPAETAVQLAVASYNAGPRAVRAHLEEGQPLPEETARYVALVMGLWNERALPASPTFTAWRARVRARAASSARSPTKTPRVTLGFGATWQGAPHQGVDLAGPDGTEVHAALRGTVTSVLADEHHGRVVVVRATSGLEARYAHLGSVDVREGDVVGVGARLGTMGAGGDATGIHVHFEVRDLGEPVDPAPFFGPR